MIGIFLLTHGTLGEALVQCACHVLGQRPPQLAQLGLCPEDDPELVLPQARALLEWVDDGDGVLLLSDICGATPANLAARLASDDRVAAVSGVNLPMLLRALTYREQGMDILVERAIAGGRDGVVSMHAD